MLRIVLTLSTFDLKMMLIAVLDLKIIFNLVKSYNCKYLQINIFEKFPIVARDVPKNVPNKSGLDSCLG